MNGKQEMGGVMWGRSERAVIPSSTAALSEIIYVGRASFRVALEVEAPAPAVTTAAWFNSLEADEHEPVVLASGRGSGIAAPRGASEPSDGDGVPILYDSEVLGAAPRRQRASRWTVGLPLAFGAFFCGILISPLVSPTGPRHERASGAESAPAPRVVSSPVAPAPAVPATAPVVPPVIAPVVPPVVAPVVAPALRPESVAPAVAVLSETFANRRTTTGTSPGVPVQGRAPAGEKNGLHKMIPRRPARVASSSAWVDPWADN